MIYKRKKKQLHHQNMSWYNFHWVANWLHIKIFHFAIQMSRKNKYRASFIKRPLRANVVLDEGIPRRNNTEKLSSSFHQCHPLNDFLITLNICNWSLKFASPNVMVAAQEMFARSSWVTRSFTASECTSSFWENVVTVSHLKRRMKAMRAGLCDESGITVRKKYGNSSRSLRAGAVLPNDTFKVREKSNATSLIVYPHITLLELCSSRELFWPNFPSPRDTPSLAEIPSSSCSGYKWREKIDRPRLLDHTLRVKQFTMWEFETVFFGDGFVCVGKEKEKTLIYFTDNNNNSSKHARECLRMGARSELLSQQTKEEKKIDK